MLILVINSGSSSLKFNLFDMNAEESIVSGMIERIGMSESIFSLSNYDNNKKQLLPNIKNHYQALNIIINYLQKNVLLPEHQIAAIGHRITHGGMTFTQPSVITEKIILEIKKLSPYAPLHNPANINGVEIMQNLYPNIPHIAVFDTSFHHTIPDYASIYGIPYHLSKKLNIKRYGFHGTSHQYVALQVAKIIKKPIDQIKTISCHLGNGSSISAIKYGKSIDTSMGLTPLEGVIMGTRCGNLDPGIILTLMKNEHHDYQTINDILNKQSGLLGLSGISSDCREIEQEIKTNDQARLALEVLWYNILKYIGSYTAVMNGIDTIVFTGGIGENSHLLRSWICNRLSFLGLIIDDHVNLQNDKKDKIISTQESKVVVAVIKTNEELMIAKSAHALLNNH